MAGCRAARRSRPARPGCRPRRAPLDRAPAVHVRMRGPQVEPGRGLSMAQPAAASAARSLPRRAAYLACCARHARRRSARPSWRPAPGPARSSRHACASPAAAAIELRVAGRRIRPGSRPCWTAWTGSARPAGLPAIRRRPPGAAARAAWSPSRARYSTRPRPAPRRARGPSAAAARSRRPAGPARSGWTASSARPAVPARSTEVRSSAGRRPARRPAARRRRRSGRPGPDRQRHPPGPQPEQCRQPCDQLLGADHGQDRRPGR